MSGPPTGTGYKLNILLHTFFIVSKTVNGKIFVFNFSMIAGSKRNGHNRLSVTQI
jgi:hypothetical protein